MITPTRLITSARVLFDITRTLTTEAGLYAYETSNHARSGAECRHNLIYWQAQNWLGIGPGAYGRFFKNGVRTETRSRRDPHAWLDDVTSQHHGIDILSEDSNLDYAHEALMMGLRLTCGVDISAIEAIAGPSDQWIKHDMLDMLIDKGLLKRDGAQIALTEQGSPLLNTILNEILIS